VLVWLCGHDATRLNDGFFNTWCGLVVWQTLV